MPKSETETFGCPDGIQKPSSSQLRIAAVEEAILALVDVTEHVNVSELDEASASKWGMARARLLAIAAIMRRKR